jgi:hypothetical protein
MTDPVPVQLVVGLVLGMAALFGLAVVLSVAFFRRQAAQAAPVAPAAAVAPVTPAAPVPDISPIEARLVVVEKNLAETTHDVRNIRQSLALLPKTAEAVHQLEVQVTHQGGQMDRLHDKIDRNTRQADRILDFLITRARLSADPDDTSEKGEAP